MLAVQEDATPLLATVLHNILQDLGTIIARLVIANAAGPGNPAQRISPHLEEEEEVGWEH